MRIGLRGGVLLQKGQCTAVVHAQHRGNFLVVPCATLVSISCVIYALIATDTTRLPTKMVREQQQPERDAQERYATA